MKRSQPKISNLPLLAGFILLLIMMGVQIVLALSEIRSIRVSMEQIVNEKLVKNNLAQTMLGASRERGLILTLIYYEDDPFERDELNIKFSNYAGEFMAARQKLYAMNLSTEERRALDDLATYALEGTPAMNRVMELLLNENGMSDAEREEAMTLIRDHAIPAREAVGGYLREISRLTHESSERAIVEADINYHRVWNQMLLLAVGILLLSLLIVSVVYLNVTGAQRQVDTLHQQMRKQVRETVQMFKVSVALIEHSLSGGEHPVRKMIDQLSDQVSFSAKLRSQLRVLFEPKADVEPGDHVSEAEVELPKEQIVPQWKTLDHTLDEAIVAFQDFDRISQQLDHIGNNLNKTANLLNNPERSHDESEWNHLREDMRENFVMMDAQVVYDAIMDGEGKEAALRKADQVRKDSKDNFEMF